MNEQRFFDAALDHIRQQGEPCVRINDKLTTGGVSAFCQYDGPDGKRCAFGPAILKFDPAMEGESAIIYPKENLHEWARYLEDYLTDRVQSAHDTSCREPKANFVASFNEKMKMAAYDYNREFPLETPLVYREAA